MSNMQIVGLCNDRRGLLVRLRTMPKDHFWHIHSDEMSRYQRRRHRELLKQQHQAQTAKI